MRRLLIFAALIAALSILSISVTSADHPGGPAGFWRFDEGAGTTATDSAHSNDGALTNGPTYDSVNVAPVATSTHSLHFDGVDDYVEVPDAPELDVDNITISTWVRLDSAPSATMNILRKGPLNNRVFGLDIQPNDRARGFVVLGATNGPAIIANGTSVLTTGVWYHIAMSYDGTNVRVYVDGVLEGTSSAAAGTISDNAQSVRIGGQNAAHNGGPLPLHGNLDEIQLYNRALDQDELDILAGNTPALVVDDDGEVGFGSIDCDGIGVPAFTTIQDAENAASPGDTIQVCPGSYGGATIDTADLTIIGPQAGSDPRAGGCAAPADEAIVTDTLWVQANGATLDGFSIDAPAAGLGTGVYLQGGYSGHTVINNIFRNNVFGLYLNSDGTTPTLAEHNCFISNNTAGSASGNGIYADQGTSDVTINENYFEDNTNAAIVITNTLPGVNNGIDITDNESLSDGSQIAIFLSDNVTITGNDVTTPLGSAIFLGGDVSSAEIAFNTITDAPFSGVRIADLVGTANSDISVHDNSIDGVGSNDSFGVRVTALAAVAPLDIDNNTIGQVHTGVLVASVDGVTVTNNDIDAFSGTNGLSTGIRVTDSTGVLIQLNAIDGTGVGSCVGGYWGIYVSNVSGDIDQNDVSGIGNGLTTGCQEGRAVEAAGSGDVDITDNLIDTYQKSGIIVRGTVNSVITGNTTTGAGPSTIIAMNGITITSIGTTLIDGNDTTLHEFISVADPTFSCGILYVPVGGPVPGDAYRITNNQSTHDEVGICVSGGLASAAPSGGLVSGNTVTRSHQRGIDLDTLDDMDVSLNTIDGQGACTTSSPGAGLGPDDDRRCYGILISDATGSVDSNDVTGIHHAPNGIQSGIGIRASARSGNSTDVDITNNTLSDYQKGGIVVVNPYGGTSVHADIVGNSATGYGPINFIAQNGIQVSNGATATVDNNESTGHDYTPATFAATGLLILGAGTTDVTNNNLHDNMENAYIQSSTIGSFAGNDVVDATDYGVIIFFSDSGDYSGNTVTGNANVGFYVGDSNDNDIHDNLVDGNGYGFYVDGASDGTLIHDNRITNNTSHGVDVEEYAGTFPTDTHVNQNCIVGNGTGMEVGASVAANQGGPVDAENNWWGSITGPNPPGTGDTIVDTTTVDADPWLMAGIQGCLGGDTDTSVVSVTIDCPANVNAGSNFVCVTHTTVHNNGPVSPADAAVTVSFSAPGDCTVSPVSPQVSNVTLTASVNQIVDHNWTVNCSDRSDHSYAATGEIETDAPYEDSDLLNNARNGNAANAVFENADLQITAVTVNCPDNGLINVAFVCTVSATVHNNGPVDPAVGDIKFDIGPPFDCTAAPAGSQTAQNVAFPASVSVQVDVAWSVTCTDFSNHIITGAAAVTVDDVHVQDPNAGNNSGNGQDTTAVLAPTDVKVTAIAVTAPAAVAAGNDFGVTIDITVHNNGPVSPLQSEGGIGLAVPGDCTVDPAGNYQLFNPLNTPASTNVIVTKSWTVNCTNSGAHEFIACGRAGPKTVHTFDPNPPNGFMYQFFNVDVDGDDPDVHAGIACSVLGDPDEICDNGIDDDLDGLIDEGPDTDGDGINDCEDADIDGDGFSNNIEEHVGTDSHNACPRSVNDSAWPADFNNSRSVNISDVLVLKPSFGASQGSGHYHARTDINASGAVNISDVLMLRPFFGSTCQ